MLDFEKFTKYSKPGPRYTSYPTALEFEEGFTCKDYIEVLQNMDAKRPLSLYFHLPFCRSACYFCGCNVVFTSKEDKKERYISYLKKELKLLKEHLDMNRSVMQMHFGGGTPTFFDAAQLKEILDIIHSYFPNFANDAEISCEIDPRFLSEEQLDALVAGGINRISFGVQDFDELVQKTIHRIQPYEVTKNAVEMARAKGIKSINMDLIYGLPFQTLDTFKETLRLARTLDTDRFAIFNYAHVPWIKKTMRKLDETTIPQPSEKLAILKHTIDYLTNDGLKMIGMDHFAKPKDELFLAIDKGELHRNFQGYTTKGGADLIGIGLTSIGEGVAHYAQNAKDLKTYEAMIDAGQLPIIKGVNLDDDDRLRKAVIMELMSNFKLNISRIEDEFKVNFKEYFATELSELLVFVDDDLIEIKEEALHVKPTGTMLIRNIAMPFDKYTRQKGTKKRFSKTV